MDYSSCNISTRWLNGLLVWDRGIVGAQVKAVDVQVKAVTTV